MKYLIAILLFASTAVMAEEAPKNTHRLSARECEDMALVYFTAASERDQGSTQEFVMSKMEAIRDSTKASDSYIFDLVKAGVAYVFRTPKISPELEMQNFSEYCNKAEGHVDSESDYFKGNAL